MARQDDASTDIATFQHDLVAQRRPELRRVVVIEGPDAGRSFDGFRAQRPLRTVAVVSRRLHVSRLDALLDAGGYDVVFIESIENAYSQIKRTTPHVVILCLEMDDAASLQILSMLKLDRATCDIPVITYVTEPHLISSCDDSVESDRDEPSPPIVLSMN